MKYGKSNLTVTEAGKKTIVKLSFQYPFTYVHMSTVAWCSHKNPVGMCGFCCFR